MIRSLDYATPQSAEKPSGRNERRWPMWKWLLLTLVIIVVGLAAYIAAWLYIVTNYHPEWL
jgi:hypothetical protein